MENYKGWGDLTRLKRLSPLLATASYRPAFSSNIIKINVLNPILLAKICIIGKWEEECFKQGNLVPKNIRKSKETREKEH